MLYRYIDNVLSRPQNQTDYIRITVLILQHTVHNISLCRKIACNMQLLWPQHDSAHDIIHPCPKITKSTMLLIPIACIYHIMPLLQTGKKLAHFIGRRLSVVIQTHYNIAICFPKSCHKRSMLSKILRKINSCYIIILTAHFLNYFKGIIWGTVIYQHNIILVAYDLIHGFLYLAYHSFNRACTPITGNHEADLRICHILFVVYRICTFLRKSKEYLIHIFPVQIKLILKVSLMYTAHFLIHTNACFIIAENSRNYLVQLQFIKCIMQ